MLAWGVNGESMNSLLNKVFFLMLIVVDKDNHISKQDTDRTTKFIIDQKKT